VAPTSSAPITEYRVYIKTKEEQFTYRGCFGDAEPRAIPTRLNNVESKEECEAQAIENGFDTFGLQNGNECWCGVDPQYNIYNKRIEPECPPLGSVYTNQVYKKDTHTEVESCRTTGLSCEIENTVLQAAPFSYEDGESVEAKVTAINIFGSEISSAGSGGILPRVPDAPQAPTARNLDYEIEFTW